MKLLRSAFTAFLILTTCLLFSQMEPSNDWYHLDPKADETPGISTHKTYKELLKGRVGQEVIVAVMDSGVDYLHEDLKEAMWVNPGEIPDNGKDDDKNGYIDDIHGWNFLGNAKGENIRFENLEMIRLYNKYKVMFEEQNPEKLSKEEKALYQNYKKYEKTIEEKQEHFADNAAQYGASLEALLAIEEALGKKEVTLENVKALQLEDAYKKSAQKFVEQLLHIESDFERLKKDYLEIFEYHYVRFAYNYNPEFDARSIVGDNPEVLNDQAYGNNNVKGPDAEHGTQVAGIIAARRDNQIGIQGIADRVKIMSLRVVPEGDERDKDIAKAIRYAVDNGAQIINMSFGKGASPQKKWIDEAVKYAEKKDVLIVHAAGNDNIEITAENNYPNDRFQKPGLFGRKYARNWVSVGASTWELNENFAADFSNYSPYNVDVFAPGVEMYSTTPENGYDRTQGTSFSAPVVAGVAAVLRSYFPALDARQVKEILIESSVRQNLKVTKPGTNEEVPFRQLSVSGGVVNVYEAVSLAAQVKGNNKKKRAGKASAQKADGKNKSSQSKKPKA